MKIVNIFAGRLFAFHYTGEIDNEYDRLMDLWTDTEYLRNFLKANQKDLPKGKQINDMATSIIEDSDVIDNTLVTLTKDSGLKLTTFFRPLHNQEYQTKLLSKQKGRENVLRMYAIKIDEDCFVITGGAIKLTQLMEERAHTQEELHKLERARSYLKENGIGDADSFFELFNRQ